MKDLLMRLGLVGAALLVGACTELEDLRGGVCGNGVVEAGEDCDGNAGCNPAGKAGACRFACETSGECRPGWVCGADAICREPTGEFAPAVKVVTSDQMEVLVGELNGSRPADIVSVSPGGELIVRYGGEGLTETASFNSRPIMPAVGRLSQDQIDDLVHVTSRALGVLLGTSQRVLRPMAYAPIAVADPSARFVITEAKRPAGEGEWVYALDDILEFSKTSVIDSLDPKRPVIATLPFDISTVAPSAVAGELPVGDIDSRPASPCNEIVLAPDGASEITIYSPCKAGGLAWNSDVGALPKVKLAGGATVTWGAALADLDGDGELDLLIIGPSAGAFTYSTFAAFGAGDGTFNSTAPAVPGSVDHTAGQLGVAAPSLPLAVGDLNGDGRADFVFPNGFVWSRLPCAKPGVDCYTVVEKNLDLAKAVIGDFNANKYNDLVAIASNSRSVYFLNGNGTNLPTPYELPTEGEPTAIAAGDFDGDLVRDVAIAQRVGSVLGGDETPGGGSATTAGNVLTVAFGNLQGPPGLPQRMGELGRIDAMAPGHLAIRGFDQMSDLGVLGADQEDVPSVALFSGASNRQMQSPFELSITGEDPDAPAVVQAGRFEGEGSQADIAAIAVDSHKKPRLWLFPTTGDAALSLKTTFATEISATFDPCATFLVPLDADGDSKDELFIVARQPRPKRGTQIMVAKAQPGKWEIGKPVVFDDFTMMPHFVRHLFCRTTLAEKAIDLDDITDANESDFGDVEVADLDGAGPPELILLAFSASNSDEKPFEAKLVVFPDGNIDPSTRIDISLPPDTHPFSFTVLNADQDPELEVAYFSPEGIYVADLDLSARTLTNRVTLMDPITAQSVANTYEESPPLNMVSGDFNGDGIVDIAMAYQAATEVYYGKPVLE